jgi:hypothetical protein
MFRTALGTASISGLALVGLIPPALAGMVGVPAPIIGVGLPLLLVAAGAYFVVKLVRARRH